MNNTLAMDVSIGHLYGVQPTAQSRGGPAPITSGAAKTGVLGSRSDQADIEDRLINWGRWCKSSETSSGGHCGSIEWKWIGKWKGRYGWADPPDITKILNRINVIDAEAVQSIMIHLPITYRQVLVMMYVRDDHPKKIAHKIGCKEWALESLISDAKKAAEKCLTGIKNKR